MKSGNGSNAVARCQEHELNRLCRFTTLLSFSLAAALVSGCRRDPGPGEGAGQHSHSHGHGHGTHSAAKHQHTPPHGGAPVVLGEEAYHLEFLLDSAAGKLDVYVLDGHMENFIRIGAPSLEIEVSRTEGPLQITLAPVESPSTGEKAGDTCLFSGKHDALKGLSRFDAKLKRIEIRSRTFENVEFNYPKGNE